MIPACVEVGSAGGHEVWFLHGILGSGQNWRTFARSLLRGSHGWKAVLVDHRNHGDSERPVGAQTVRACAEDLAELAVARGTGPAILVGHSFGGKVALAATPLLEPRATWVLDALPGPVPDRPTGDAIDPDVASVLAALGRVQMPLARREEARDILTGLGLSQALAAWMTTNLVRRENGLRWRFHLPAVQEMIEDYARLDLWPLLDRAGAPVHVVRAGRSDRWTPAAVARLAARSQELVHVLPDAGHWVHVDAPDALRDLLLRTMQA